MHLGGAESAPRLAKRERISCEVRAHCLPGKVYVGRFGAGLKWRFRASVVYSVQELLLDPSSRSPHQTRSFDNQLVERDSLLDKMFHKARILVYTARWKTCTSANRCVWGALFGCESGGQFHFPSVRAQRVLVHYSKPWMLNRFQPAIPTVASARRHEAVESHRMVAEQREAPEKRAACMAVNDRSMHKHVPLRQVSE